MPEKRIKLLIVDDDTDINAALQHYLSQRGYDVQVTNRGAEALRILAQQTIDIVLLDIVIPDINGDILAKAIKEYYPATKVVIQTGYPAAAQLLGRMLPIDDFCTKPCRIEEIFEKLQHAQEA